MMNKPPPKETCLQMARHHCEVSGRQDLMWDWLLVWAAYEDWLELYFYWEDDND